MKKQKRQRNNERMQLPNRCSCSIPTVTPSNWEDADASTERPWMISYRFYSPGGTKPVQVRGMNDEHVLRDRRDVTKGILDNEIGRLKQGYNPILNVIIPDAEKSYDIPPTTPFIQALRSVQKSMPEGFTKRDVRGVINGAEKIAGELGFKQIPISTISRKHIKAILNQCTSAHKHNKYRTYLKIVFDELFEMEATENDPLSRIKKKRTLKKIRTVLTKEERQKIDKHLVNVFYHYWRFMHIFFHSGSRETEMMAVKYEAVDLENQRFKIIVKKGKEYREAYRTIKDIVLPLWMEVMKEAQPGQYLFSWMFKPGTIFYKSARVAKWWRKLVKAPIKDGGLGIKADFYSLKHSNLDEVAKMLSVKEASMAAGHTSERTTKVHYLFNEEERQHQRLKSVNNQF